MFQFATGVSLANSLDKRLVINTNWYKNPRIHRGSNHAYSTKRIIEVSNFSAFNDFDVDSTSTLRDGRFEKIIGKIHHQYWGKLGLADERNFVDGLWRSEDKIKRLVGYFMSPKYFNSLDTKILFKNLAQPLSEWTFKTIQKISSENAIGIHVRLGDYLLLGDKVIPSENYYLKGLEILSKQLGDNAKPYLFTDDSVQLTSLFPILSKLCNIISPPSNINSSENLLTLAACKAFVCSNSTFSWWAVNLSSAGAERIVRPSYFYTSAPEIDTQADLWHLNSIKLNPTLDKLGREPTRFEVNN